MSAPEPNGRGAAEAMRAALARAGLMRVDGVPVHAGIDYVQLHGTATPANDLAEDHAVCAVLGREVPCSASKGVFGHTLGAAGMVGAAVARGTGCLDAMDSTVVQESVNVVSFLRNEGFSRVISGQIEGQSSVISRLP